MWIPVHAVRVEKSLTKTKKRKESNNEDDVTQQAVKDEINEFKQGRTILYNIAISDHTLVLAYINKWD